VLLAGKVEDMINTVVRQIAFYDFECKLHAARREGELTPDDINALWMSVQAESLGPVFEFMPGYETFWAYIPHFVHSPFYVYAYAFGDGLVNALYAVYEEGGEGFQEKYFDMLKAGGSKHHKELLAPFGLDASDPAFWDKGLGMIEGFIDQLEALEADPGPNRFGQIRNTSDRSSRQTGTAVYSIVAVSELFPIVEPNCVHCGYADATAETCIRGRHYGRIDDRYTLGDAPVGPDARGRPFPDRVFWRSPARDHRACQRHADLGRLRAHDRDA
jgi:hypothetical protein